MKKLRERQVSLRMALTMCAAAGAITAVICLISTGWNTNEVGKKLREIDRLVSEKYVGELDADNVADYAAAGYITGLGDKWSSYIPAENYEAYRMSGEGKGCGIGDALLRSPLLQVGVLHLQKVFPAGLRRTHIQQPAQQLPLAVGVGRDADVPVGRVFL